MIVSLYQTNVTPCNFFLRLPTPLFNSKQQQKPLITSLMLKGSCFVVTNSSIKVVNNKNKTKNAFARFSA